MKLFLASSIDKTLPFLSTLVPGHGKKVLFVANAADPYSGDKFWVRWDRDAFQNLGYEIREVDLREITPEDFERLLNDVDILHVCGGSVYYLVALLREKQFETIIVNAIKNESIIYTGTSAGSIVVSKNIKPFSYDQEEAEQVKKVLDHKGLGLIDFSIVPHCNQVDFVAEHQKMVAQMRNDPEPLFFLQDNHAIWIDGDTMKLVKV